MDLLPQLSQFVLRLAFGLALGMALVSPRQVTSGYFRNTLYVLLGLSVLAGLVAASESLAWPFRFAVAGAAVSYIGSVAWLYERSRAGRALLVAVALSSLAAAWSGDARLASSTWEVRGALAVALGIADAPSGGAVLGFTMAAMLLGHWYLNSPTMQIAPLVRLIAWMAVAVAARGLLCGAGLAAEVAQSFRPNGLEGSLLAIRWACGIVAPLLLAWMAWRTLAQKTPNTQSATGILYVAVIATFAGELASQLLSAQVVYPV